MNVSEFTYLLNKPDAINTIQIVDLDRIIAEFSYFQSARSILLKGLHTQDSFKYNQYLKATAAHTTDRSVLFDFITSEHFTGIQKATSEIKETETKQSDILETFEIPEEKFHDIEFVAVTQTEPAAENTLEKSILSSIKEATQDLAAQDEVIEIPETAETIAETIEIKPETETAGEEIAAAETEQITITEEKTQSEETTQSEKPVSFTKNETHSFQEWLQLSKIKPIDRTEENSEAKPENTTLEYKLELIDKFIETNPKIPPPKEDVNPPLFTQKNEDTSYLMTETLAKVYLEQKKYNKAIQAYEILILKYPEKSSLFADRILEIKELQQNNK